MANGFDCDERTFGGIFTEYPQLEVPLFQRSFKWQKDNIERLWRDVKEALAEGETERTCFLGSVVLYDESAKRKSAIQLLDGQQRLTSLMMFLCAFRTKLKHIKKSDDATLAINDINRLVFKVGSGQRSQVDPDAPVRLVLSKKDRQKYEQLARVGTIERGRGKISYLERAWTVIQGLVQDEAATVVATANDVDLEVVKTEKKYAQQIDDELVAMAQSVVDLLNATLIFSVVEVKPPYDPLMVFERLNSTGLGLAPTDLIKNWILGRVPDSKRKDLLDEWERLTDALPGGEATQFIRYWYMAKHSHVTNKRLYQSIKDIVSTEEEVAARMAEWNKYASWYAGLVTGTAPAGGSKVEEALRKFALLDFRQGRPILLAFIMAGAVVRLPEATRLLAILFVRVVKTQQVRASTVEAEIEQICKAVRDSPTQGMSALKKSVRSLSVKFAPKLNWENLVVADVDLQRYLLNEINNQVLGVPWSPHAPAQLEVEHILPQNPPDGDHGGLEKEEYHELVNNIGNLTLILQKDNARCGNRPIVEKASVYAEYGLTGGRGVKVVPLTAQLGLSTQWGLTEIQQRSRKLAEIGESVWPIPD